LPVHDPAPARQRLDKWLWCARFARTREAAADLAASGHVRINSQKTVKPGHAVKVGDILTLVLTGQVLVVRVAGLAERRGSAPAARLLYETQADPQKSGARQDGTCY
jgi:ribosome-associated heat shock protein Hsp15